MATNKTDGVKNMPDNSTAVEKQIREAASLIRSKLDYDGNLVNLMPRYEIGVIALTLMEENPKFRREVLKRVAKIISCSQQLLVGAARVAAAWDRETFSRLAEPKVPRWSHPLKWGHFVHLASLSDPLWRNYCLELTSRLTLQLYRLRSLIAFVKSDEHARLMPCTEPK